MAKKTVNKITKLSLTFNKTAPVKSAEFVVDGDVTGIMDQEQFFIVARTGGRVTLINRDNVALADVVMTQAEVEVPDEAEQVQV